MPLACWATHLDAGNTRQALVPRPNVTLWVGVSKQETGNNPRDRVNPQPSRLLCLPVQRSLRCGFSHLTNVNTGLKVRATPTREGVFTYRSHRLRSKEGFKQPGSKELACGSQAFIATLLFDPSMSALPIIPKQNSV